MDTLSRRELFKKYSYDLINTEDINELQNLFDYASGVVIKDEDLANKYETDIAARNSNTYIKACYKMDNYSETQREQLKKMYEEGNKYYKWLEETYNIDPLNSRTAEDYSILTSISNTNDNNGKTLLNDWQEQLFLKCYNEALFYWNNVTRTKSFKNEQLYRSFTEVYLLFVAIQKYITYRMKFQFNVDTFNKFQCKNYFISNGVDYFDDLPLIYQRRLIKLLNDLQRDKGDNEIFEFIKTVLMVKNINVYKYVLTKYQPTKENPKGDLFFYKVPYNEELNVYKNDKLTFESITNNDPYWRASKNEILYQTFNTLDTKYISVEYVVDILKNSRALSYFMYLLNDSMLQDKDNELKTSLFFNDKNISSNQIKLYDAMLALFSLFFTYLKNDDFTGTPADKIDFDGDGYMLPNIDEYPKKIVDLNNINNPLIINIYGYTNYTNDTLVNEKIMELNKIMDNLVQFDRHLSNSSLAWINNLRNFLNNKFNLRDFYYSENYTMETIEDLYKNPYKINNTDSNTTIGNLTAKNEFLELASFIKIRKIYNTSKYNSYKESIDDNKNLYALVQKDKIKESFDYLRDLLFNGDLNVEYLSIHRNLKIIFKKYLAYCIINKIIITSNEIPNEYEILYNNKYDIFYSFMVNNETILTELIDYCHEMYGYDDVNFNDFLNNLNNNKGIESFITFLRNHQNTFYTSELLYSYRNLLTFLEIFCSLSVEIHSKTNLTGIESTTKNTLVTEYSKTDIATFMNVLNKNEQIRTELEKYIMECNIHDLYYELRNLWELRFKSDFNFDLYYNYESFKNYLLNNDEELYKYVTNFGNFSNDSDRRKEIETRILDLSTSIEKYISSNENIIYNSSFNVIFNNMKDFVLLLIKVFKAYTLDTIYSGNVLDLNDPLDERVKIFDEMDETTISDLELDTPPEYIDAFDDVRKENGDLDATYNLILRNLIKFTNDEDINFDINEIKNLKIYANFFESSENLPYGFTDLTPEEFEAKYNSNEDLMIPNSVGLDKNKYKYIKEHYYSMHDIFKNENGEYVYDYFSPINILYINVYNYDGKFDNLIERNKCKIFKVILVAGMNGFDKEGLENIRKDYLYKYNNKWYLNSFYNNAYHSELLQNIENCNEICYLYDTGKLIKNRYIIYKYNNVNDSFEEFITLPECRNFERKELMPYVYFNELIKDDLPEGKFNIYYDPYLKGGYANNHYYYNDYLMNILNNDNDLMILGKDIDVYNRKCDNRRENLFYMRDDKEYNYTEGNRIIINKKLMKQIVKVPNENYINYLKEHELYNENYLYKLPNTNGKYYVFKDGSVELKGTAGIHTIEINGNEVNNLELKLGKKYYISAYYKSTDTLKLYKNNPIVNPEITLYFKKGEITKFEYEILKTYYNIIEPEYEVIEGKSPDSIITVKLINKLEISFFHPVKNLENEVEEILNYFDFVSCKKEDDYGYVQSKPFKNMYEVYNELMKYKIIFIKNNNNDNTSEFYIYNKKELNYISKIGTTFNTSIPKATILFEPLRYYNDNSFRKPESLLIDDESRNYNEEKIPYAIDIMDNEENENTGLPPLPLLKKEYSYNGYYKDYLRVFHQNYTKEEIQNYHIDISSYGNYVSSGVGLDNIFEKIDIQTVPTSETSLDSEGNEITKNFVIYNMYNGSELIKTTNIYNHSIYSECHLLLSTSYLDLSSKIKLDIPDTINNNAWLLTFYNSIEKPDTSVEIKINIPTAKFGFIYVENKGVTNPKDNSTLEYLNTISELNTDNQLHLWDLINNTKIPVENEEDITINNYSYNENDSNLLKTVKLLNSVNNFNKNILNNRNEIHIRTELVEFSKCYGLYDTNNYIYNLFKDTEKENDVIYDYEYAKSVEGQEKVKFSKIVNTETTSMFKDDMYKCFITIIDNKGNTILDNQNIFDESFKFTKLEINTEYTFILINVFENVPIGSSNFMAITSIKNSDKYKILNNTRHTSTTCVYENDLNDKRIFSSVEEFKIIFNDKVPNLDFDICGLVTYDSCLEYELDNDNLQWMKINDNSDSWNYISDLYLFSENDYDSLNNSIFDNPSIESTNDFITHTFKNSGKKTILISKDINDIGSFYLTNNLYDTSPNPFGIKNFSKICNFKTFYDFNIKYTSKILDKEIILTIKEFKRKNKYADISNYLDYSKLPKPKNENETINEGNYQPIDKSNTIWVSNIEENTMTFTYGKNTIKSNMYDSNNELLKYESISYICNIDSNKYLINIKLPSHISCYNANSFKGTKIKRMVFGCLTSTFSDLSFCGSELEEMYFINNSVDSLIKLNRPKLYLDFYLMVFADTKCFKNKHFKIKFPYNTNYFGWSVFDNSTFNGLDFTNCYNLIHIGTDAFTSCHYFGRRYLLDNNDNEVLYDNKLIYENEDEFKNYINKDTNELLDGYKYSEFEYLDLPHGINSKTNKAYSFFRIYGDAFASCDYIKMAFLGNAYLIGNTAFCDCYRLNYVYAPEVRYLGSKSVDDIGMNQGRAASYENSYIITIYSDIERTNVLGKCYSYSCIKKDKNDNSYMSHDVYYTGVHFNLNITNENSGTGWFNNTKDGNVITYYYSYEKNNNPIRSYYNFRTYDIANFYGTTSDINTFAFCYSLLDVIIGQKVKTIHSNLLTCSGLYSMFNNNGQLCYGYFDSKKKNFVTLANNNRIKTINYETDFNEIINNLFLIDSTYNINIDRNDIFDISYCNNILQFTNNLSIVDNIKVTYQGTYENWKNVKKKQDWNSIERKGKFNNVNFIEVSKFNPTNIFPYLGKIMDENDYYVKLVEPDEVYMSSINKYSLNTNEFELYNLKDIMKKDINTIPIDSIEYKLKLMINQTLNSHIDGYINDDIEDRRADFLKSIVIIKGKSNINYDYTIELKDENGNYKDEATKKIESNRKQLYKVNYSIENEFRNKSLFIDPYYSKHSTNFANCEYNNYYLDKIIYEMDFDKMLNYAQGNIYDIYDNNIKENISKIFKQTIERAESINMGWECNNDFNNLINDGIFNRNNVYDITGIYGQIYPLFVSDNGPSNYLKLTENTNDVGMRRVWITNSDLKNYDVDLYETNLSTIEVDNRGKSFFTIPYDEMSNSTEMSDLIENLSSYKNQFLPESNFTERATKIAGLRTLETDGYKTFNSIGSIINIYSVTCDSSYNIIEFVVNQTKNGYILEAIIINVNQLKDENGNDKIFIDFENTNIINITYQNIFDELKNKTTFSSDYSTAQTIFSNGIREFKNKIINGETIMFT